MLESFLRANDELSLGAEAIVLTRDPRASSAGRRTSPPSPPSSCMQVTSATFDPPEQDSATYSTWRPRPLSISRPTASFLTAVEGTRRVLGFAVDRACAGCC